MYEIIQLFGVNALQVGLSSVQFPIQRIALAERGIILLIRELSQVNRSESAAKNYRPN